MFARAFQVIEAFDETDVLPRVRGRNRCRVHGAAEIHANDVPVGRFCDDEREFRRIDTGSVSDSANEYSSCDLADR